MGNMRIAILYEDKKIYIEFSEEKFRKLLNEYYDKYGSIDLALDEIVKQIKIETLKI